MSIAKAFLALLSERPMNGNQLRNEFEARTGATWPLNIGQAYTTLQRLERDRMVVATDDSDSATFTLTEAGAAAIANWWQTPVTRPHPARDELAIKLTLAVTTAGVDVKSVVQVQRTESMRTLHEYTALKRSAGDEPQRDLAWRLLLESLIFQTEAEIRWLDHVEASVLRASSMGAAAERPKSSPLTVDMPTELQRVSKP